jgi:hypothetical protein
MHCRRSSLPTLLLQGIFTLPRPMLSEDGEGLQELGRKKLVFDLGEKFQAEEQLCE